MRFQGVAYSGDFAAIGLLCVVSREKMTKNYARYFFQRWAPLAQTGTFIAVLTSFTPVSSVITNPVAGWVGIKF